MSYTIKLRDGDTATLDDNNAESLMQALSESKGTIMVELGDNMVRSSQILSISKDHFTEADRNRDTRPAPQLIGGKECHGQFSIQREINNIIKDEGRGWAVKIKNLHYREGIRKKLLKTTDVEWCDYKADLCACEL